MEKDIRSLLEIKYRYKRRKLWKKFILIFSSIIMFLTIYFLILPAITLEQGKSYKFNLKDSYDYSWKEGLITEYNLNLYFMDTDGNYIEGRDVDFEIGPDNFEDDPYGFGSVPISGETTRGLDIIEALDLDVVVASTGEKYEFDHAEVYVDNTWQLFSSVSKHWDIWCQNASSTTSPLDYGWRGKYGDEVGYTINENTQYKFVYKLVRYGQSKAVDSLGADSGISFNIFNYSGDNSKTLVNDNGLYNYFTFRGVGDANDKYVNADLDADGFTDNRAKVLPNLENGYPVFNCQGQCDNDTSIKNTSLGYLFGAETNAKGEATVGVVGYNPTNTPLQKEMIDGVEYYYYDSNRNAVDYDTENNRFMLRDYVERGYSITTYGEEALRYEFLPFNYWNDNKTIFSNTTNQREYNYEEAEVDHWFGMTMEFSFYMPKNGTINDKDMIFEFSGDDDVWVFIDDVLVLDLGGTHGAVDGSINFNTGEVEGFLNWNGTVGTKNKTTIYEAFGNALATGNVEWDEEGTSFKDYTKHTLKFFYLERGASVSNCKIKFNIPVLPSGSIMVQKQFEGIDNYNDDYEFTLYDVTSGMPQVVANTGYTIDGQEFYTDEAGRFTLKNNEVAIFKLTNYHKYYVSETNPGEHAVNYKCSLDGVGCLKLNQTDEFIISPESMYQAIFTNKVKTFNLKVSKIAYESDADEIFEFKINLKDKDGLLVDIIDDIDNLGKYVVDHDNGVITFSLKNGEYVTIKDISIDTVVNLQEVIHDGYQTIIKSGDIVLSNGDNYEFIMDSDKDITVYNIPGVMLPETGGFGVFKYLFVGIGLILLSIICGYNYFFIVKEGGK